MEPYVAVVDYGMGNLRSVMKALAYLGAPCLVTGDAEKLRQAAGIILPGVGAFPAAARRLSETGLGQEIVDLVLEGKPLLGICLGMQLLYEGSEEGEGASGLGLIPGLVRRLSPGPKIPHMGWNSVSWGSPMGLLEGLRPPAYFYFVHSYAAPANGGEWRIAVCDYGVPFAAAVERGTVAGTQFHPEKSGAAGLKVLHNFLVRCGMGRGGK